MRIMTTNIWGDYFNNPVEMRLNGILKVYENYRPDIIGFQEVTDSWYRSGLFEGLSCDYRFAGTSICDNCNYTPLAYKKEYSLIASGFERLDGVTDTSKVITWAVLKGTDGKSFGVCNTHFWWMTGSDEHERLRLSNADQLSRLMEYLRKRFCCPVFAFGDMNCRCTSKAFTVVYLLNGIVQLYDIAEKKDDIGSHHGDPVKAADGNFKGSRSGLDHTYSIDHIIGTKDGYNVKSYSVVEDSYVLDATDHSPVYADIELL